MKVDADYFQFISKGEGNLPTVYKDGDGVLTIGIGHALTTSERSSGKIVINGVPVHYKDGLTSAQIVSLCGQDTRKAEECVNGTVTVTLTQSQYNALVSFAFNVGTGAFASSTLLKKLNAGDYSAVPEQLRRWVRDGGRVVQGLVNRRNAEIALWNS
jgi:lysozyme